MEAKKFPQTLTEARLWSEKFSLLERKRPETQIGSGAFTLYAYGIISEARSFWYP
jgi:hypothetical protein